MDITLPDTADIEIADVAATAELHPHRARRVALRPNRWGRSHHGLRVADGDVARRLWMELRALVTTICVAI